MNHVVIALFLFLICGTIFVLLMLRIRKTVAKPSEHVLRLINQAAVMTEFAAEHCSGNIEADNRNGLLSAFLSVAFEHQGSILLLLRDGFHTGSAFALVRTLVDTTYRAQWAQFCATDDEVQRIRAGEEKVFPVFKQMTSAVEAAHGIGYFGQINQSWSGLCGYTHSGVEQLGRRFNSEGELAPTYSDIEIIQVVHTTVGMTVMLAVAYCAVVGKHGDADAIMAKFNELIGPWPQ